MENINQEPMSPAGVDDQVPARSSSPTRSAPPPTPDAPAKNKNKWSVRHSRISNKGAMNPKPVPVTMFPRFLDLFGVGRQDEEEEQQPKRGQKKREPGTYNDPRDYTKSRLPYFYAMAPKKCRKGKAVVLRGRRATGIPKPYFYKPSPCRELLEFLEAILINEDPQLGEKEEEQPEEEQQEEKPQLGEEEEEDQPEEEQQEEPQLVEEEEEQPVEVEEEEPEWAWELLEWELPQQHLQEPQVAAAAPKSPPPRQHRIRAVSRRHNRFMLVRKGLVFL